MTKYVILYIILLFITTNILSQNEVTPIFDSDIKGFLDWKIATPKSNINYSTNIKYYSSKIVKLDTLKLISFWQKILKFDTTLGFDSSDLVYAINQIKSSYNDTIWNKKLIHLKKLSPKMKKDKNIKYWEFSRPIFNKSKTFCIAWSNINCFNNYCHSIFLAVYKKTDFNEWLKVKSFMQ